ncbi:hypothetical protein ACEPAF_7015 [Sanghuangporus sanghuang]
MEAFYNNNAWLSTADALRGAGHDQQHSPTPTAAQNGVEWGKPGDIDLSDFGLGDLQASNASPTSTPSMQHMYQFPPNGYFATMAPFNMIPYGQAASTSSWPQQNLPLSSYSTLNGATSSIGTSQPQQQQQPHQQHSASQPPSTQQSAIDPSLTSTTGSTSYSPPPSASSQGSQQSSSLQFSIPFHQQQQQQQHPHQNMHSPVLAVSPVYLMQQQAQQQQQQQRTLNPQQLTLQYPFTMYSMQQHAQSPMQTNLTATTSQSATPPPASSSNSLNSTIAPQSLSAPAPELDPVVFKQTVDQLLSPSGLSNAYTVRKLMDAVAEMGSARVTPEMRIDIASRIRDNAGNAFFAAWARDAEAMVLLVSWLKAGVAGKDEGKWECTIMPLLHVLDRLPLTISLLREHRLGKLTTALLKSETVSPAIKDMASNISNKWRNLIEPSSGGSTKEKDSSSSKKVPEIEDKTKKRKLGDTAPKPPSKVAVVSSGTGTTGTNKAMKVKKEKVVVTAVKDAKADSSFFSTPKPKPKLPSFKKAPVASTASTTSTTSSGSNAVADVAQPNNDNPFQQALKEMKGRAAVAIAASSALNKLDGVNGDINTLVKPSTPDLVIKNGKKRKSVSWAPEGHLEKVRIIERAVYDDDHVNEMHGVHSIRDLERAEGAAMHIHLFEEAIDWYEPNDLEFPQDIDSTERGAQSEEKVIQEEREKITLGALYFADSDIPETPGEPATQIPIDQVDSDARTMVAGADIEPFFQHAMSVSDLVGQLKASTSAAPVPAAGYGSVENAPQGGDVTMSNVNNTFGVSGGFDLSKLDPNALSSLAVSLGLSGFNFGAGAGAAVPDVNNGYSSQNVSSAWGAGMYNQQPQSSQQSASYSDSNYAYDERDRDERNTGRGSFRGRGRGGSAGFRGGRGGGAGGGYGGDFKYKKRCNFYAQGRRASDFTISNLFPCVKTCRYGDQCHFLHELD